MSQKERIILGIDPGTTIMGYGVIRIHERKMALVDHGVIRMTKEKDHYLKLQKIFRGVRDLIDTHLPDELAIEAPFFGKNVQSMLKLGRAQGIAMAAALDRELSITEYSPRKIKQSITGSGSASKEQVAGMIHTLLKLDELPKDLDATDGLAAAVCHFFQSGNSMTEKSYSGWAAFAAKNADRIS
jgi:crossover junction endodeoxyribonuclease RuvC